MRLGDGERDLLPSMRLKRPSGLRARPRESMKSSVRLGDLERPRGDDGEALREARGEDALLLDGDSSSGKIVPLGLRQTPLLSWKLDMRLGEDDLLLMVAFTATRILPKHTSPASGA